MSFRFQELEFSPNCNSNDSTFPLYPTEDADAFYSMHSQTSPLPRQKNVPENTCQNDPQHFQSGNEI